MIIKHSQGRIDSVYKDEEWQKLDEKKEKVGEEKPLKKEKGKEKKSKKGS